MSTLTDPTPPPPAPRDPLAPDWAGPKRLASVLMGVGFGLYALGLGLMPATAGGEVNLVREALAAWLVGWVYWFSLPLGGLALLMIHYLAKSSWGLLLRRPFEAAAKTLPVMAVLFAPIAAGACLSDDRSPFWWTHPETAHADHADDAKSPAVARGAAPDDHDDHGKDAFDAIRAKKFKAAEEAVAKAVAHEQEEQREGTYGFLSAPAFLGVAAVLFCIWGALIYFLTKWSDEMAADPAKVDASWEKLKNLSGPGLIIYAITITAASTQWVMSLQPGWASTMYPVIFAVNQFLTCFAFGVAVFLLLVGRPPFRDVMRPKFQLDMGSLMLALTLFWAYTTFSQTMLIWIGNLPEEIPYYLKRSNDTGWWWVSAFLIFFHFALPFVLLLFRDIKLHPVRLRVMAVYLLAVIAVDVTWWVQPTWDHPSGLFVLATLGAILGIGGLWGMGFLFFLSKRPLFPMNEAYLLPEGHEGHHDEHH
ncbi:MAG: hypothetical protein K2X82_04055 [Gemmataceae bacterium]|nr:hypothetical protein [Gemmataceae bacterium]